VTRHSVWHEARATHNLAGMPAVILTAVAGLFAVLACAPGARAAETPAYPQGAAAFQSNCAVCHGATGAGAPALAPPLVSEPARFAATPEGRRQLVITLLYGMFGEIAVGQSHFNSQMPDFARLDDETLAATLNYVAFELAHAVNTTKPFAPAEIAAERAHPLDAAAVRARRQSLSAQGP
jgi:mono/diheme cytochrome c family protein